MADTQRTPRTPIAKLRIGKYRVPMTDDEAERLQARLEAWIEEKGIPHGFVRGVLDVQG